jgi:hypothetical protein
MVSAGNTNATNEDPFLVVKYFPPGFSCDQESDSAMGVNPFDMSIVAAFSTACQEVGDSFKNLTKGKIFISLRGLPCRVEEL